MTSLWKVDELRRGEGFNTSGAQKTQKSYKRLSTARVRERERKGCLCVTSQLVSPSTRSRQGKSRAGRNLCNFNIFLTPFCLPLFTATLRPTSLRSWPIRYPIQFRVRQPAVYSYSPYRYIPPPFTSPTPPHYPTPLVVFRSHLSPLILFFFFYCPNFFKGDSKSCEDPLSLLLLL